MYANTLTIEEINKQINEAEESATVMEQLTNTIEYQFRNKHRNISATMEEIYFGGN